MKNYIKHVTLVCAIFSAQYLTSYTVLDQVTLKNGKKVEILQLAAAQDGQLFQAGKETLCESFEDAYAAFTPDELYLENKPGFLDDFLKRAFEDEENDFNNNKPNSYFLVARDVETQEVIGFVGHDVMPEKRKLYIRQLAVACKHKRQDLGKVLALDVIDKIAPDTQEVVVCTRIINTPAVHFYQKNNFTDAEMQDVHPELPAYKYRGFRLWRTH